MATITAKSYEGEIRPIKAMTDTTLWYSIYDPDQVVKTVTGYAARCLFRGTPGGRVLHTYSTCGGGISIQSAPSGRFAITIDASDLRQAPDGEMEFIEYSGGTPSGDPTDRFAHRVSIV